MHASAPSASRRAPHPLRALVGAVLLASAGVALADGAPRSVSGNQILAGGKPASSAGNSLFWNNTGWGGETY